MKLVFSAQDAVFEQLIDQVEHELETAGAGALQDVAHLAVEQGRNNIAGAGFPSRWQSGLRSKFYRNEGNNPAALIFHRLGFASVFEFGATIAGRPLLWLPIEANLPQGVRSPRKYGRKMVSVNIAGKPPLLFDAIDRQRGPLFVGVRSVHLTKRFDLLRIFAAAAARFGEFYEKRIKG